MKQIFANNCTTLLLGRQGENLARQVAFDVQDLADLYGPGTVELIYQRPGDEQPYPIAVERDGNTILWTVNSADTSMANKYGRCELRYYVGDTLAKSKIWRTLVESALDTPSEEAPPEPQKGWVDRVLSASVDAMQAAEKVEDALTKAPKIGENGNWYIWDATQGTYVDTGRYSGGSAPYIGLNGNWFIGTEDSGVSATGPRGPAGNPGLPGEKGDPFRYEDFTSAQLEALRGPAGHDGTPGKDGADGKDGYTPVKGVDYFDGEPGEKGDPFRYEDFTPEQLEALRGPQGEPGPAGSSSVTVESIQSALGFAPANEETVNQLSQDKLDKPETAPEVGKILKVQAVNEDGTFTCEWDDAPIGGVDNQPFELIEEITITESVESFERTMEPDGTPYDFRRIAVILFSPNTNAAHGGRFYFYDSGFNMYSPGVNFTAGNDYMILGVSEFFGMGYQAGFHTLMARSNTPSQFNLGASLFSSLHINHLNFKIPTGGAVLMPDDVVKIYGMRW